VLTSFWQGVGTKLAERWVAALAPSMVFWGIGLAVTGLDAGSLAARPPAVQVLVLAGALLLVSASALLVRRLVFPLTRLLEGYGWPVSARGRLLVRAGKRHDALEKDYQRVNTRLESRELKPFDRLELLEARSRLELDLRRFPDEPDTEAPQRLMPTRLGNILRAAESRPADKYGLDAVVCWPRLWLVLPEESRKELGAARTAMDNAVAAMIWSALLLAWTPWTWWALVGPGAAFLTYRLWLLDRAADYGELVESAFDVHRGALYAALRWPLPAAPDQERALGESLTSYLWRGSDAAEPRFADEPE
jgi:hypothetical protein